MHPAPTFAMVSRDNLRLVLSSPSAQGGGGESMRDGRKPESGGWNRFSLNLDDLEAEVARLRREGVRFRNEIMI